MRLALDTSVLVASLDAEDLDHLSCRKLLLTHKLFVYSHALTETFSTLTGGTLGIRLPADEASEILRQYLGPRLEIVHLTTKDLLEAYGHAKQRGIRGGAIYDYLHLVAARKVGADRFHTLNLADFQSFHRFGDPEIVRP